MNNESFSVADFLHELYALATVAITPLEPAPEITVATEAKREPIERLLTEQSSLANGMEDHYASACNPVGKNEIHRHEDVEEMPTFDGYVNRRCRTCGEWLRCRKGEATPVSVDSTEDDELLPREKQDRLQQRMMFLE